MTVFLTGFLILEFQVGIYFISWENLTNFPAMDWCPDQREPVHPVPELSTKDPTGRDNSRVWWSLSQSCCVAQRYGWVSATVLLRGQGRIILLLECLLKVHVSLQVKSLRVIMWFMVKTTRTVGLRSCPPREKNWINWQKVQKRMWENIFQKIIELTSLMKNILFWN